MNHGDPASAEDVQDRRIDLTRIGLLLGGTVAAPLGGLFVGQGVSGFVSLSRDLPGSGFDDVAWLCRFVPFVAGYVASIYLVFRAAVVSLNGPFWLEIICWPVAVLWAVAGSSLILLAYLFRGG